MSAPNIDLRTPSTGLLEALIITIALLEANPLTASLAQPFVDLYKIDWTKLVLTEFDYLAETHRADALVQAADDAIDDFADAFDKTLLRKVKNNREDPLYAYYFGAKRPHALKRPILAGQLSTMRTWITPLKTSSDPDLVAAGTELEAIIANADLAITKQANADEKVKTFRTLGDRKTFIDKFNALREITDGKLGELRHLHPELRLPTDFASRFFKHASRHGQTPAKELTSDALKLLIANAKEEVAALEAKLTTVLAAEEAKEQAEAQIEADKAALAAAEAEEKELAAKVKALKAKISRK